MPPPFSPADTFPLTPRAKLLMMAESAISLITIAVVASWAVGIFKLISNVLVGAAQYKNVG